MAPKVIPKRWEKPLGIFICIFCVAGVVILIVGVCQLWPQTLHLDDEQVMALLVEDIEESCSRPGRSVFYVCDRIDFRQDVKFQQALEKAKTHGLTVNFVLVTTEEEEIALARIARIIGVDAKKASGFWTSGALVCGSQSVNGHRKLRYRPYSKRAAKVRGEVTEVMREVDPFSLLFLPAVLPAL